MWFLSARLVILYVLSAQHVKCGVLRDEHIQIWHSSIILTLQFYTNNRYRCKLSFIAQIRSEPIFNNSSHLHSSFRIRMDGSQCRMFC